MKIRSVASLLISIAAFSLPAFLQAETVYFLSVQMTNLRGVPKPGEFITRWVINNEDVNHVFLGDVPGSTLKLSARQNNDHTIINVTGANTSSTEVKELITNPAAVAESTCKIPLDRKRGVLVIRVVALADN